MKTVQDRIGWCLGVLALASLALTGPADARGGGGRGGGGGGRGGGGGGGYSRTGPASSGSFGGGGSAQGRSAGSRGASAQSAQAQRGSQGSRQQAAGENQAQRQQASSDRTQTRQEQQNTRQEDSQQHRSNMQEDRQDAYDDAHWGGSYYRYPGSALAGAAVIAAGTAVTVATIEAMTTPSAGQPAACTMTSETVGGVNYYRCGPNYFQKAYVEGEMAYVAVAPPGA